MSNYRRFAGIAIIVGVMLITSCDIFYIISNGGFDDNRYYAVEVSRVVGELEKNAQNSARKDDNDIVLHTDVIAGLDLSDYRYVTRVSVYSPDEICNSEYAVEEVNGVLYRIEYDRNNNYNALLYMNIAVGAMLIYIIILIVYMGKKIVKPFGNMNTLTTELAKGNLAAPIKEEKSRYMGRFLWGLDMLRENLEDAKEKEIELQKEKKELILSISHDIKTPLAAIELYSKALSEDIYDDGEKRKQALEGIANNTKTIKKYVDDIINASKEDFINMDVKMSEFYLSELIDSIEKYYTEKLDILHTEFIIEKMSDCLLKGDFDRVTEVLQNIIENAIKYGDGKCISLSSFEEEDCRIILVENTGNSLKNEELTNIFDSFYRGSNSKGIKGSGLGLYICRKLMQNMDGDIYAKTDDGKFLVGVVMRKV